MEKFYINRVNSFKGNLWDLQTARTRKDILTDRYVLSGLISKFCLGFDLSWKCMKDVLVGYHGINDYATGSPRETLEKAFEVNMIEDDGLWLSMLKDRNRLSHDYNSEFAYEIVPVIIEKYLPEFERLEEIFNFYLNKE